MVRGVGRLFAVPGELCPASGHRDVVAQLVHVIREIGDEPAGAVEFFVDLCVDRVLGVVVVKMLAAMGPHVAMVETAGRRRPMPMPEARRQGDGPPVRKYRVQGDRRMNILEKPKYGNSARFEEQTNSHALTGCDHSRSARARSEYSGKFFEQILGGVEFFRAGYSETGSRARRKPRHIFYHVGKTLRRTRRAAYRKGQIYTNADGENMNPHFAFGTTVRHILPFAEHLKREGVPFAGPRRHVTGNDQRGIGVLPRHRREHSRSDDVGRHARRDDRPREARRTACRLERTQTQLAAPLTHVLPARARSTFQSG